MCKLEVGLEIGYGYYVLISWGDIIKEVSVYHPFHSVRISVILLNWRLSTIRAVQVIHTFDFSKSDIMEFQSLPLFRESDTVPNSMMWLARGTVKYSLARRPQADVVTDYSRPSHLPCRSSGAIQRPVTKNAHLNTLAPECFHLPIPTHP